VLIYRQAIWDPDFGPKNRSVINKLQITLWM
jgi:hypothetical protein